MKIHIDDNGSDKLTKVLLTDKLNACRQGAGLLNHPIPELKGSLVGEQVPSNGICMKLDPYKESDHLEDIWNLDYLKGIRKLTGSWPHKAIFVNSLYCV